ncbi:TIGR01906 family membrane protein [Clostridium algidicarnis]|uniref:Integral membrane protein (TIGR01906 family) n=2 Tax=Clostridium algidicarnis TaxID=37659 RepID=A0A2S6FVK2_9CLOT|nr:TIGR01906 family membrane protein [Clostridium algidicarnis]MBU3204536.1 TIGR01906 family membrane protein [Clostridium algidicarnis]MBU3206337.1 TIGR01906 family membrane protein [Clostridium algidicarnis]MBU3212380.1 TIGR01906 family membrane protein [Clostridium algidicarnis]MBU3219978.1 TIGR01906 family membrane protein [Clostridium algidicarnis]MBU3222812.1 TIGR01906 family membrane protein [Clostridium algidicarnis]
MNKLNKLISLLCGIALAVFLLTSSTIFALNFKTLYKIDTTRLNIPLEANISKEATIKNYTILIDYLNPLNNDDLIFEDFFMSHEGREHFVDVKNIFNIITYVSLFTFILSLILIAHLSRLRNFSFLKYSYFMLILIPLTLAIPFIINFDKSFVTFHEIFFSNDYWLFDPIKDPIINILPQEFFFHESMLILSLLVVCSIILIFLHKKLNKNKI